MGFLYSMKYFMKYFLCKKNFVVTVKRIPAELANDFRLGGMVKAEKGADGNRPEMVQQS